MSGILICDDNPNIRYLLRVYIETKTEFKVCGEAGHGTDAIEKVKKLQPDLILLIGDLALSKSDGIKKLNEHLKTLLAPIDTVVDEVSKLDTPIANKPV